MRKKYEYRQGELTRYWIANMRIVAILIAIWAAVSLGCGVLLADYLNQFNLPGTGYPLGFWFAQQGSIITFVVIILVYCVLMNGLDAKHHRLREAEKSPADDADGSGVSP